MFGMLSSKKTLKEYSSPGTAESNATGGGVPGVLLTARTVPPYVNSTIAAPERNGDPKLAAVTANAVSDLASRCRMARSSHSDSASCGNSHPRRHAFSGGRLLRRWRRRAGRRRIVRRDADRGVVDDVFPAGFRLDQDLGRADGDRHRLSV